jgi:small subunit ribosomal protein S21
MEKHIRGVNVKSGESVDRALKRLKTKLDTEGILEEMRRRRSHESTIDRAIRKARTAPKRNKLKLPGVPNKIFPPQNQLQPIVASQDFSYEALS